MRRARLGTAVATVLVCGLLAGCTAAGSSQPATGAGAGSTAVGSGAGSSGSGTAGSGASGAGDSGAHNSGGASWLPKGATVTHASYGSDAHQDLDVYRPVGANDDPVILMVHGGGWTRGDKAASNVVDNKVAHYLPAGFVFVSTNYRLSPEATPPVEAQDVASALAYVQKHAAQWGGDGERVVLMGHSAGANLVSLVATDPAYARNAGAAPWLGTVSLDSAAYDVPQIMDRPHRSLYDPVFGHDTQLWAASSPTLVLDGTPAPMLLVCSTLRADSCPQADAFASAARSRSTTVTVVPVALHHEQIDKDLGTPGTLTNDVDRFIGSLTGKPVS